MKKTTLAVIAAVFGGTLSLFAQGTVSSINAAGYIKVDTEPNKFYFVQNPFTKFDNSTTHKISEILGTTLGEGSQVFLWNFASQTFSISTFGFGQWSPDSDVERGQGFFVQSRGATDVPMFLHGQVPGATTFATTDTSLSAGFNALGWPYPTAITLEESGISSVMAEGDQVFLWNGATQGYTIVTFGFGQLSPANVSVPPGSAVFVRLASAGQQTFSAAVPYTWPNN